MAKPTRLALHGIAAAALCAVLPMAAGAADVTIDSVVQRWPWNNKVDITYTVTDAQKRSDGVYYALNFALSANGQTYAFEGNALGASAETGGSGSRQYTVTWTAPEGIVCTDASLTATLFATNVPSGNDYMIVDLDSGAVFYEGLCASQADSNARYNTAEYKEDKLVLRKVPRTADSGDLPNGPFAGGYPTGDSVNCSSGNDANNNHRWTTDRDYYIGVFLVTQYQYQKLCGSNPSLKQTVIQGNVVAHRPAENMSWNDLRTAISPSASIPSVSTFTGTFFQRLNYRTGLYFDLPTEVMFEIAARAGATTTYAWGSGTLTDYAICTDNAGAGTAFGGSEGSTVAVGSLLPNSWGLYDTFGNVWDVLRDRRTAGDMTGRIDVFTPDSGSGLVRLHGGHHNLASSVDAFKASFRGNGTMCQVVDKGDEIGFRVTIIPQ